MRGNQGTGAHIIPWHGLSKRVIVYEMASTGNSELQNFLDRYRFARAEQLDEQAHRLTTSLSKLRPSLEDAKRLRSERARLLAPDFNVFTLLRASRKESAHSDFLAELLDPRGEHGQGALFLSRFVRLCSELRSGVPADVIEMGSWAEKVTVQREATIFKGRCDLLIHAPRRLCLLIENKVDAPEEETQLARYRDWLSALPEPSHMRLLVFLTPHGQPARSLRDGEYIRLSYALHLSEWLQRCMEEIQAPCVRSVVEQYVDVIAAWKKAEDAATEV